MWATGNRVIIRDKSEADGDSGTIAWVQANGIIIVNLDVGCAWPVLFYEIESEHYGEVQL